MTSDRIVIVHGPMGSGKSRFSSQLLAYFQSARLIDTWDGHAKLRPGDLALTSCEPPFRAPGATVLDIATALRRCRVAGERRAER